MDVQVNKLWPTGFAWARQNAIHLQVIAIFTVLWVLVWVVVYISLFQLKKSFKDSYYKSLDQKLEMVAGVLASTAGETALQNDPIAGRAAFSPYLLNVSAVDVQSPRKAFDVVAQNGCLAVFDRIGELCAGIGNQPNVGAYLYFVGWIEGPPVTGHQSGSPIDSATRLELEMKSSSSRQRWVAVFQPSPGSQVPTAGSNAVDLYATGYRLQDDGTLANRGRDEKEFRGRLNYAPTGPDCLKPACSKRWQFSFRVPLDAYRDQPLLVDPTWPPADLYATQLHLRILSPSSEGLKPEVILDSDATPAAHKYSLDHEIGSRFDPLEQVSIFKVGAEQKAIWSSRSAPTPETAASRFGSTALALIPVQFSPGSHGHRRKVEGKFANYLIVVQPSEEIADTFMTPFAAQLLTMLFGTLFVTITAWGVVEWRIVGRVRQLTQRTNAMSEKLRGGLDDGVASEFGILRKEDELGVLASGIDDLLTRVNDDVREKRQTLNRLHDLLSAIGHEIVSPLQSLSMLHPATASGDLSRPYILRMESAVKTLMSSGSLAAATWEVSLSTVALNEFLRQVAASSRVQIVYEGPESPVLVKADDIQLDQVLGHVLSNAKAFSPTSKAIRLSLKEDGAGFAEVSIFNEGPPIKPDMLESIFDLGVSDRESQLSLFSEPGHLGQGLYVARQLMTAMGGSIHARNCSPVGVAFIVRLPLAPG